MAGIFNSNAVGSANMTAINVKPVEKMAELLLYVRFA